jgi:large subunit ribosomal protein L31
MKKEIHPDYHPIKVVMTDGTEYETRSTWGEAGGVLRLDVDSKTHPAWTGGDQKLLDRGGRLSRFNNKFAGLTAGSGKAPGASATGDVNKPAKAEAKPAKGKDAKPAKEAKPAKAKAEKKAEA